MKKTSLIFLSALLIFVVFTVFSLFAKNKVSSPSTAIISATPSITSNTCIITINNQKYDVTQFREKHPGGNIFNCSTDMTTIFNKQHSQRELDQLQQYLVK